MVAEGLEAGSEDLELCPQGNVVFEALGEVSVEELLFGEVRVVVFA